MNIALGERKSSNDINWQENQFIPSNSSLATRVTEPLMGNRNAHSLASLGKLRANEDFLPNNIKQ